MSGNNDKSEEYKSIDFTEISGFRAYTKKWDLYHQLLNDFSKALSRLSQKQEVQLDKDAIEFETKKIGNGLLGSIKKLAADEEKKGDKYDEKNIDMLNQVLYRSTLALYDMKNTDNLTQMSLLSKKLPGVTNKYWKALAIGLFALASIALVTGILLAIPIGGGSVLFTALAAAKLTTAAAAIANAAAIGVGYGLPAGVLIGGSAIAGGVMVGGLTYKTGLFKDKRISGKVGQFGQAIAQEKDKGLVLQTSSLSPQQQELGDQDVWRGMPPKI